MSVYFFYTEKMDSIQMEFTPEQFRFLFKTLYEFENELEYLCDEDENDGCDDIVEARPENKKKLISVKEMILLFLQQDRNNYM